MYVFNGLDKTYAITKASYNVTFFQIGVFKRIENTKELLNKHPNSIVLNEEGLYRVYIALAKDEEIILAYENYFRRKDINYYKKVKTISSNCLEKISEYENIIKRSFNEDIYEEINGIMLNYYTGGCHD